MQELWRIPYWKFVQTSLLYVMLMYMHMYTYMQQFGHVWSICSKNPNPHWTSTSPPRQNFAKIRATSPFPELRRYRSAARAEGLVFIAKIQIRTGPRPRHPV